MRRQYNGAMSLVVREDLSVAIPEALAAELGLHGGSSVEWERTEDGALKLRPARSRTEAIDRLSGMGKSWVKPGESGVERFLKERQEERELDPTYHQWSCPTFLTPPPLSPIFLAN